MEKQKLGFIFFKDLNDRVPMSGTVSFINEILSNEYDIVPIVVKDSVFKCMIKLIIKVMSHDLNRPVRLTFTPIEDFKFKRLINKVAKNGVNLFFTPFSSEIVANIVMPSDSTFIYLSDCTYHAMVDYYFSDTHHAQHIGNEKERKCLKKADIVIHSNDWAKRDAIEYYGIKEEKIHVLPFGANLRDSYEADKRANLKECTSVNMLLCGVDWERKGVDLALECTKILNLYDKQRKYKLIVCGLDKPKGSNYDNVTFIGRLNKNKYDEYEQLIECYKKSDIFLLPTKAECSAIVFAEAAMYGLPIFTHITGGVQTYVKDGVTGRCLPIGSTGEDFAIAIKEMIDSNKYKYYSDNSRKYYEEKLNWEVWLSDFKELLREEQKIVK